MATNQRHLLVNVLCIFFGIGTWLCVNGLWVELPLLVNRLPEGWSLPSYMAVIIQLANLGPITYTILHSLFPSVVTEKRSIYAVISLGIVTLLLLVQFWMKIASIGGVDHSVAFFGLVLILAAVDCSSRVIYLPFMAKFKPEYLTSYFIGEGLSGFVPSIFAVIQGTGGSPECNNFTEPENGTVIWRRFNPDPLFSVEVFLYLMVIVTVLSGVAFYLLNKHSIVSKCLAKPTNSPEVKDMLLNGPTQCYNSTRDGAATWNAEGPLDNVVNTNSYPVLISNNAVISNNLTIPQNEFISLMILLTMICILANGVFPSIQSYSCLPYGSITYHWAVTLSAMSNPTVCFLMLFLGQPPRLMLIFSSVLSFIIGGYILFTAMTNPSIPLIESILGHVLLVASWILLVGLFTYAKVSIATIMRIMGKRGLFWTGVFTQVGSSIGAVIAFSVVNFTNVFQSYEPCQ